MTQTGKDLLLKDLCARLPYFTKVQIKNEIVVLDSICDDDGYHFNFISNNREGVNIEEIKPYLFPMSSMTEEQMEEYCQLQQRIIYNSKGPINKDITEYINWCYKNHLDINDLIPMGLAIDVTGKNIY